MILRRSAIHDLHFLHAADRSIPQKGLQLSRIHRGGFAVQDDRDISGTGHGQFASYLLHAGQPLQGLVGVVDDFVPDDLFQIIIQPPLFHSYYGALGFDHDLTDGAVSRLQYDDPYILSRSVYGS